MKRGITSLSPDRIELAKVGERQIDVISQEELKRLLEAPNKEKNPEKNEKYWGVFKTKIFLL